MARLFSQRHRDAILDGKLVVSFQQRLNRRVWMIMERFNDWHRVTHQTGWNEDVSTLSEAEEKLKEAHGWEALGVKRGQGTREVTDFKGFVAETYPSEVLDAIEAFYFAMDPSSREDFVRAMNEAFEDEGAPWRLSGGQFFKVDSEFLQQNVLARSQELLVVTGFEGALEEFREARNDLESHDYKGAIHNACKAYESTLKAVLGVVSGNASTLIEKFEEAGFLDDLPGEMHGGMTSQVMCTVPFLRNRLGGHGQGEAVLGIEKHHAELAVHLGGALIVYVIEAYLKRQPDEMPEEEEPFADFEQSDGLPF